MNNYIEKMKKYFHGNINISEDSDVVRKYPKVEYKMDSNRQQLERIAVNNITFASILELIFYKLGYKPEDNILIESIHFLRDKDGEDGHQYIVKFSINEVEEGKIIIQYRDYCDMYPMIITDKDNVKTGYNIKIYDREKDDIRLNLVFTEKVYSDSVRYRRDYSYASSIFEIFNSDYNLKLEICRPSSTDMKLEGKYILDNEEELVKYLLSLSFPIGIDEVYRNLSSEYLGDISKYTSFKLEVNKYNWSKFKYEMTDLIDLYKGRWEKFGMTEYGQTIMLDKDGNWSYRLLETDSLVNFSMNRNDGSASYTVKTNSKINADNCTFAQDNISFAENEVDSVKKLVRMMFVNDGRKL